jgi:hypothetical protein
MKDTLTYDPVDGYDVTQIVNDIAKYKAKRVIIFNELEWEQRHFPKHFYDLLKEFNIEFTMIHGSFPDKVYDDYCDSMGLEYNQIQYWPTFWISWTEMCLRSNFPYKEYTPTTEYKYPFISLNNKGHVHRCALIDHLARHNLIDKGVVTYHNFVTNHGYPFKYYDGRIRTIDDDFATRLDSFLLPEQFHQSFLHVVGEATITVNIISEKTLIPIFLKKPFISLGKEGFNKCLTDLGFELYTELFDYSFDSVTDMETRASMVADNVNSIVGKDYNQLYELIKPKLIHNYNRAQEIIHDINYIHPLAVERVNYVGLEGYKPMHSDGRYINLVNQCLK